MNTTPTAPYPGSQASSMDQVVLDLLEGIAMQEMALSGILNAESQKMVTSFTMEGMDLNRLLELNDSAANMIHAAANLGLVLKDKLEFVTNNLPYTGNSGIADGGNPAG